MNLPLISDARDMLDGLDIGTYLVRGVVVLLAVGFIYIFIVNRGESAPLPADVIAANLAPVGKVRLEAPPAPAPATSDAAAAEAPAAAESTAAAEPAAAPAESTAEPEPAAATAESTAEAAPAAATEEGTAGVEPAAAAESAPETAAAPAVEPVAEAPSAPAPEPSKPEVSVPAATAAPVPSPAAPGTTPVRAPSRSYIWQPHFAPLPSGQR